MTRDNRKSTEPYAELARKIKLWGSELGFQDIAITDTDVSHTKLQLQKWLDKNYHGTMGWMADNLDKRTAPSELVPGAIRVISARMNYLPPNTHQIATLKAAEKAYISRYALGRDYHKVIRKRLSLLAKKIEQEITTLKLSQRAFVDSAPILERPLAEKAGLGWTGKHTLLIHPQDGSWFFLGEILTNLPLPLDKQTQKNQCGDCVACLKVCPTDAFPSAYQLDARRCISYLTIEKSGPIPLEFREPMGNRVFGCDDCQAICPWNKYAKTTCENDFHPRHKLECSDLVELFQWDEPTFLKNTEGSPIRRIGYERWLRNLAVGLGNAPKSDTIIKALNTRKETCSEMVREHIEWAIERQLSQRSRVRKLRREPRK